MAKKKIEESTAVAQLPSQEALAMLRQSFPVSEEYDRLLLPRLSFVSQDKMEGVGRDKKVTVVAGTFFEEIQTQEEDENGKKIWNKNEIGQEMEATIIYFRKQLRLYDEATETYTSSSIYDTDDEIIPLFSGGTKFTTGTPAELKKKYEYTDSEGKLRSKLEDNLVLYILYSGKIYQMSIRGSSMWSLKNYKKTTTLLPAQLTKFSSEPREKGKIAWNVMIFSKVRDLSADEVSEVQDNINTIVSAINQEKSYFRKQEALDKAPIPYVTAEQEGISADKIPF